MILASLLSGSVAPAANHSEQFRAAHPQAQGFLAGRRVLLADALGELLQQARAWPTPALEVDWPTFAGNARRDAVATAIQDVSLTPAWKRPLDPPGDYQAPPVRRWAHRRFAWRRPISNCAVTTR